MGDKISECSSTRIRKKLEVSVLSFHKIRMGGNGSAEVEALLQLRDGLIVDFKLCENETKAAGEVDES